MKLILNVIFTQMVQVRKTMEKKEEEEKRKKERKIA